MGNSNAILCEDKRGVNANMKEAWNEILSSVNYTEWKGGELKEPVNEEREETDGYHDEPVTQNCDSIIIANLEENSTMAQMMLLRRSLSLNRVYKKQYGRSLKRSTINLTTEDFYTVNLMLKKHKKANKR